MRVHLFATLDPTSTDLLGPFVAIREHREAFLPPHPDGLEWGYFVTTTTDDSLLLPIKAEVEAALSANGYFLLEEAIRQPQGLHT